MSPSAFEEVYAPRLQFAVRCLMAVFAAGYFSTLPADVASGHSPLGRWFPSSAGITGAALFLGAHLVLRWLMLRRGYTRPLVVAANWLDLGVANVAWLGDPASPAPMMLFVLVAAIGNGLQHGLAHFRPFCYGAAVGGLLVVGARIAYAGVDPAALFAFTLGACLLAYTYSLVGRIEELRVRAEERTAAAQRAAAQLQQEISDRVAAQQARETMAARMHEAQRLEAIGRLAGGVAHDINNVLASIAGLAEVMRQDAKTGDVQREDVDAVLAACWRGASLTRNLLGFARKGKFTVTTLALNDLVREARELLRRTVPRAVALELELEPELRAVAGDQAQLTHALINLAINASQAMPDGGSITFRTHNVQLGGGSADSGLAAGDYVSLEVVDTGAGMDAETRRRAFEPFFTTKPVGEGTGLGLSMVHGAIASHGGRVTLDSAVGRGTTVTLLLPALAAGTPVRAPRRPATGDRPGARSVPGGSSPLVLLVDDEPELRAVCQRALEELGYRVIVAGDGKQALAQHAQHGAEISAVVLDMIMPVMDGETAFEELRRRAPTLPVILASGFSADGQAERLLAAGAAGFLLKPFAASDLAVTLAAALVASGQPAAGPG